MNKKISRFVASIGAIFLIGGVVACGGNPAEPEKPTTKTVEINFWHTFGQTIQDNLAPQLETFKTLVKQNEKVDVKINVHPESNYDSIKEQIDAGIKIGQLPTLAVGYPDHVAGYMYAEGAEPGKFVVNLEPYINDANYGLGKDAYLGDPENDSIDDFIPSYIDAGRHYIREGTYTFPYMKSSEAMLYNMDAVTKVLAHYKPEFQGSKALIKEYMDNLDWAEFINLCRETLKYKNEINPELVVPAFYDSDSNLFISQLLQAGGTYSSIDPNTHTGKIEFENGESRQIAEKLVKDLQSAFDEHLIHTKGSFSTYGSDSFKNVESVFTIGSTGGSGYSLTSLFEIGVCKVPSVDIDNPLYVCQGPDLCIFNDPKISESANRDKVLYAWKLVKFLTNPSNNCDICISGSEGYLPVRESAYYDDLYLEWLQHEDIEPKVTIAKVVTDQIGDNYFSTSCFMGSAELRKFAGSIVTDALIGNPRKEISDIFTEAINAAVLMIK